MDLNSVEFSEEIIIEILSRLPVKSLMRFKCVCKLWKTTISDAYFIRKHLNQMSAMDNHLGRHVLFTNATDTQLYAISLHSLANYYRQDQDISLVKSERLVLEMGTDTDKDTDTTKFIKGCRIEGSCNGLVFSRCVYTNTSFLWNPSTREIKILPDPEHGTAAYHGFGYDSLSDDYKVVRICLYCKKKCQTQGQVQLYSLRTNSWREIQKFPYILKFPYRSIFIDNYIIWFGFEGKIRILVSFDLSKEIFQEIVLPQVDDDDDDDDYDQVRIGVLRGYLCVIYITGSFSQIDIWIMKEYGVAESWLKWFTLPFPEMLMSRSSVVKPLCLLRNNEIMLAKGEEVVIYKVINDTYKCGCVVFPKSELSPVQIYVESLISPNSF